MLIGPVFKCYLNTRQQVHFNTGQMDAILFSFVLIRYSNRVTDTQGYSIQGWEKFFVPDFNKPPYLLRSQGDNLLSTCVLLRTQQYPVNTTYNKISIKAQGSRIVHSLFSVQSCSSLRIVPNKEVESPVTRQYFIRRLSLFFSLSGISVVCMSVQT